jgi:ethanolaminephosphotransferase
LVSNPYASRLHRCRAVRPVTHRTVSFQVWVSFDLLRYSAQVCLEICDHLKIELFRIPYNKALPSTPAMSFISASGAEKNGMGNQHHSGRLGGRGGRGSRKQHH